MPMARVPKHSGKSGSKAKMAAMRHRISDKTFGLPGYRYPHRPRRQQAPEPRCPALPYCCWMIRVDPFCLDNFRTHSFYYGFSHHDHGWPCRRMICRYLTPAPTARISAAVTITLMIIPLSKPLGWDWIFLRATIMSSIHKLT